MHEVSNGQRALWTFLITTLAAPFFGALIVMLLSVVAGGLGKGPESLRALDSAGQLAWAAEKAVATFVWSAVPAGMGGAALAALAYFRGTLHWLEAAVVGAVVVSLGAFLTGGMVQQHLAPIAFIGATVAIAMWAVLTRAGIVRGT
jgi:hypothetical protein